MRQLLTLLAALVLVGAACGGFDDGSADTAATTQAQSTTTAATTTTAEAATSTTTTTTAEPTTTAVAQSPADRPTAVVSAPLEFSYFTIGDFDPQAMGFDVGEVTAEWYRSADGFYVVVYSGLDLDAVGPLCPGNSIQYADASSDFISKDPTPGAECIGFTTLATDPGVGALVCDGVLSYRTAIPVDSQRALYGTIEMNVGGGIMGITGITLTTPGEFPDRRPGDLELPTAALASGPPFVRSYPPLNVSWWDRSKN
jgi:hypothetical protein